MRTALLPLIAAIALAGCGSKSAPTPATEKSRKGKATTPKAKDGVERKSKRGRRRAERVCGVLACTDDQEGIVAEHMGAMRVGPLRGPRRASVRNAEADAAIADAFASGTFGPEALQSFQTAVNAADDDSQWKTIADGVVAIHGALDAEQRQTLAAQLAQQGLPWLLHSRPGGSDKGPGARTIDPVRRAERMGKRLCEKLTCTDAQQSSMVAALGKLTYGVPTPAAEATEALATHAKGEAMTEAAVTAYLKAEAEQRRAQDHANDAVWLQVHTFLDADQRATLAEVIRNRGYRALGGGRGRARKNGRPVRGK